MQDQKHMWDNAHEKRRLESDSKTQTTFAEEVNKIIASKSTILELGCGEGNDSIYFAKQDHPITATDFSNKVILRNRNELVHPNLRFDVVDISNPIDFKDSSFDVIYARLSLHYFSDDNTHKIFHEIARILANGGYLCFMCKSVDDGLYGKGIKVEDDMFELNGHVRHFFSEEYIRKLLLENELEIQTLERGKEKLYNRESSYIKVIARKR